ncbi:hypothetical protein [Thioalkalivibrio sp. ALE23]|uniref:hypothetical protein n=1 Tax=Thioalkalivibrio sp. ALE23 TaxID=1265495 RepID=UPI0012DD1FE1|nr:hypothetical protein [Thioalkalivibrio sp. ALE23]
MAISIRSRLFLRADNFGRLPRRLQLLAMTDRNDRGTNGVARAAGTARGGRNRRFIPMLH